MEKPECQNGLPFNFQVEEKFSGLSGPSLYSDLALIRAEGRSAPFVPLRLLRGNLDIERMDQPEKAFYLYWRAEFRRGNIIETDESYIRIYARELCLFTNGVDGVRKNFSLLLKLWQEYREKYRSLDSFLPRWLVDYQAVYEIQDLALPLLLPLANNSGDPLLCDIFLFRRFTGINNALSFNDIRYLMPQVTAESAFFREAEKSVSMLPSESPAALFIKDFDTVINAIDRCLRGEFRLRLFEFFCPPSACTEKREAFTGMERAGHSVYSVTGLRFSMHPPLLSFLENVFRYVEYWFGRGNLSGRGLNSSSLRVRAKNGLEPLGGSAKVPPLEEPWKSIADAELGLETASPRGLSSLAPSSSPFYAGRIRLSESNLKRLRGDSDAVRDLLEIAGENNERIRAESGRETENGQRTDVSQHSRGVVPSRLSSGSEKNSGDKKVRGLSINRFIKNLNAAELEAVKIIAAGSARELENLARKNSTMPELLIDRINSAFLEEAGDLLIGIVDEKPLIQSEYMQELLKLLKGKRP